MNTWDTIAKNVFDTSNPGNIHAGAADNILIAHPVIRNIIATHFSGDLERQALDFGAGTGGFTKELCNLGFRVTGIDPSREMIAIAQSRHIEGASFLHGGIDCLGKAIRFDLIVAVMVFQFIEDAASILNRLHEHLNKDGLLIIAVHNSAYINACLTRNYKFKKEGSPLRLCIQFGNDASIPLVDRAVKDYQFIFEDQLNMSRVAIAEPRFTAAYIDLYAKHTEEPTHVSKYLIMGYKK